MLYLGIDQHARQITVSLRDENGYVVQARQVSTEPKRIRVFFEQLMRERLFLEPLLTCSGPKHVRNTEAPRIAIGRVGRCDVDVTDARSTGRREDFSRRPLPQAGGLLSRQALDDLGGIQVGLRPVHVLQRVLHRVGNGHPPAACEDGCQILLRYGGSGHLPIQRLPQCHFLRLRLYLEYRRGTAMNSFTQASSPWSLRSFSMAAA